MSDITLEPKRLEGELIPPADKSISHRAVIIGSLAQGKTHLKNLSSCEDCLRTIDAFRNMGVCITKSRDLVCIEGKGLYGLHRPQAELYLGNSGTSLRLILGVLVAQKFSCRLKGDSSLSRRPMKRVILPLSLMGAKISARKKNGEDFAPLTVQEGELSPIHYETPVASAQVKSALLLAGLYADGETKITEPAKSRDHTERMLKNFGAQISVKGLSVSVRGQARLISKDLDIPGDISSASFFLVGACISPGSEISVQSVGLNPTRTGFLNVLQQMGAELCWTYQDSRLPAADDSAEPRGEVSAKYSHLRATTISPQQVPALIDELPILMVAATQAEGETVIQGAGELRVKETDRISAMVSNLTRLGADIASVDNDIIIRGPAKLSASRVESFDDHRIVLSMAIASLVARGRTTIRNADCVNVSFPGFFESLGQLIQS